MPRRRPIPRRRRFVFIAGALAIGFVLAACGAEVAFRLYLTWRSRGDIEKLRAEASRDPDRDLGLGDLVQPDENPRLVYRLRPGLVGRFHRHLVEINPLGLRGPLPPDPNPGENLICVVALGDSHTFGWAVDFDEAWPSRLEALLQAAATSATRFNVVNMGVPSYNAVQEVALFEELQPRLKPDFVVAQYCLNDNVLPEFLARRDYLTDFSQLYIRHLRSNLFALVLGDAAAAGMQAHGLQNHRPPGQPYEMDARDIPAKYAHLYGWDNLVAAHERLKAACDAAGAPLSYLLPAELPWEPFAWSRDRMDRDYHYDKMTALAKRLGAPVVDAFGPARDFVAGHPGWHSQDLTIADDGHPTPIKHLLFAEAVARELAPELERRGALDANRLKTALAALRAQADALAASTVPRPLDLPDPLLE